MPLRKHAVDRFICAFHSTCTRGIARGVLPATAAPSLQILPEAAICAAVPGGLAAKLLLWVLISAESLSIFLIKQVG